MPSWCTLISMLSVLSKIRNTIMTAAPLAKETIKYQMPTFVLKENLVHFAAYKKHIGFYPTPSAIEKFKTELTTYKTSKGAIQFPLDKPIPYELIDLNAMYAQLRSTDAPDGYYTLQNDKYGKDIDGIRLGRCNACVDGVCLLEETKPHPCKMMDYEGPACMRIFSKKISEIDWGL